MRPGTRREHLNPPAKKARFASARRHILSALGVVLVLRVALAAAIHDRIGAVKPPLPMPDVIVVTSDGQRVQLRDLLAGRASAIQLMFTRCRSICPIEAAAFARMQEDLTKVKSDRFMLLSLSL